MALIFIFNAEIKHFIDTMFYYLAQKIQNVGYLNWFQTLISPFLVLDFSVESFMYKAVNHKKWL